MQEGIAKVNTGPRTLETTAGTTYSWRHMAVLEYQSPFRFVEMHDWCLSRMGERGHPRWESLHGALVGGSRVGTVFCFDDTDHYVEFALRWL